MIISAILITYNPPLKTLSQALQTLSASVDNLIIIDNGSDQSVHAALADLATTYAPQLTLHSFAENHGIGAALNQGILLAKSQNASHVLLLDHDSTPDPEMVDQLKFNMKELSSTENVAAIGPQLIDSASGSTFPFIAIKHGFFKAIQFQKEASHVPVDHLITSGSFIPISLFDQIGCFDDSLFIDHIDTDWCFKAAAAGFHLYGIPAAKLFHTIGDSTCKIWLGKTFNVHLHTPTRHYYKIRNALLLNRKKYIPASFQLIELLRTLEKIIIYPILAKQKKFTHLKMMLLGFLHGLTGKSGKYN